MGYKTGFKVDTSNWEKAMNEINKSVYTNTVLYAEKIGRTFDKETKSGARWTDRKGVARRGFSHEIYSHDYGVVDIYLQGSAKNYKSGANSAEDYMEYLEFDHDGQFAILYPTVEALKQEIREKMGDAVILGKTEIQIKRDRARARIRARRSNRNRRGRR